MYIFLIKFYLDCKFEISNSQKLSFDIQGNDIPNSNLLFYYHNEEECLLKINYKIFKLIKDYLLKSKGFSSHLYIAPNSLWVYLNKIGSVDDKLYIDDVDKEGGRVNINKWDSLMGSEQRGGALVYKINKTELSFISDQIMKESKKEMVDDLNIYIDVNNNRATISFKSNTGEEIVCVSDKEIGRDFEFGNSQKEIQIMNEFIKNCETEKKNVNNTNNISINPNSQISYVPYVSLKYNNIDSESILKYIY